MFILPRPMRESEQFYIMLRKAEVMLRSDLSFPTLIQLDLTVLYHAQDSRHLAPQYLSAKILERRVFYRPSGNPLRQDNPHNGSSFRYRFSPRRISQAYSEKANHPRPVLDLTVEESSFISCSGYGAGR